jgi:hypothetical protein
MLLDPKWGTQHTITQEPWRDLLNRAADLIENHGLAKGTFKDSKGGFCIRGAVHVAAGLDYDDLDYTSHGGDGFEALEKVSDYLGLKQHPLYGATQTVAEWNNAEIRTQDEVVDALRCAALMA